MKAAWLFPVNARCGISFYSRRYVDALKPHAAVACLDPEDFMVRKRQLIKELNSADIVHIQYERAFFYRNRRDFYPRLCEQIRRPIVVTLHEVYRHFPDVFPREQLKGRGIVLMLRRLLYDMRHPTITSFAHHLQSRFYAREIFVHFAYHREILASLGVDGAMVQHVAYPIRELRGASGFPELGAAPLCLAATGFINPAFDYQLLFHTLDTLNLPWKFTWIGALRREEDRPLLDSITQEIRARGWHEKFVITGWVSDERRDQLLGEAHLYCAFYKYRSSSESLATALAAHKIVLATPIPMTQEIAGSGSLCLVENEPASIVAAVKEILADERKRDSIVSAVAALAARQSYDTMARQTLSHYERLLAS